MVGLQLSILTSILQSRVRYVAQSRVLGQVQQQQQQQINSVRYNQYLNCRGAGGGRAPPSRLSVPPSRFMRPPHRELSAGLWEEKVTVFGRKNRLNFRL